MKFFVSCLELKICTGRFSGTLLEDRVCNLSKSCLDFHLVESEAHFLLNCPAFCSLRNVWLEKLQLPLYFDLCNDIEKLKILFNCPDYLKPTAQYIKDAFDLRSKLLYAIS